MRHDVVSRMWDMLLMQPIAALPYTAVLTANSAWAGLKFPAHSPVS